MTRKILVIMLLLGVAGIASLTPLDLPPDAAARLAEIARVKDVR